MIHLRMEPSTPPMSWENFLKNSPPFSIALDGYVSAGPRFDPKGPRLNINHHEEVDRLATRSTCAQLLMLIRQGLFSRFRNESGATAILYANDCDEDVCTSVFLARNAVLVESTMNPAINRLVAMEDCLDCTAGAYPFPPDLESLQELAWVFAPYRQFRMSGGLERRKADEFSGIVTDVCHRIIAYMLGRGQVIALDTRYETLDVRKGFTVVREVGSHARTGMFADGIRAYVSVRERADGRWQYTIGRMSPFVFIDTVELAEALNTAEGCTTDRWGGGNNIIGSPRVGGSTLTPKQVSEIITSLLGP